MKLFVVGIWAVMVTLGAGFAVAQMRIASPAATDEGPRVEGLRYTSLPTMSVPVVEDGRLSGYVVVRVVYTADAGVLGALASEPSAFITDEVFRALYGSADTMFGRLVRIDLEALAEGARQRANGRLGADVVRDILIDGLNYIDLSTPEAAAAARATTAPVLIPDGAAAGERQATASAAASPQ